MTSKTMSKMATTTMTTTADTLMMDVGSEVNDDNNRDWVMTSLVASKQVVLAGKSGQPRRTTTDDDRSKDEQSQ